MFIFSLASRIYRESKKLAMLLFFFFFFELDMLWGSDDRARGPCESVAFTGNSTAGWSTRKEEVTTREVPQMLASLLANQKLG